MLAYATRLLGDRAGAEDVVQEALVRAWRNPDVLTNGKGSTRGWLLTVVRNLVIDRVRAKAARPAEVAEDPDAHPAERDHADLVATAVTVHAALRELSEGHRVVLQQLYLEGCTLGEAAERLGVPTGTVKSRSYYALRALRAAMQREVRA
jgi:RNA polymerase sigma-70 factor, ECF subfamily